MEQLQLKQIGLFVKAHGIHGDIVLNLKDKLTSDLIDEILKEGDAVFIEIDGIPVPFFIAQNGLNELNQKSILIRFDDVTYSKASKLVSSKVFVEKSKFNKFKHEDLESVEDLIGYELSDSKKTFTGQVVEFINLKGNPMLSIEIGDKKMLIPVISDYILEMMKNEKFLLNCLMDILKL
jgi:16S rRNA processing protein RimM